MKKIFTLIAVALLAVSASAETLINYKGTSEVPAGITLSGTTVMKSVKKNANTNTVDCIQLANGYTTDNIFNNNAIILSTEGGFKAGDVLSVTAFFNHNDPKTSKVEIITINDDGTTNVIWTSEQFINGKYEEADPEPQTYTLEQDMEKIYIGRNGNTGTNIIALSVVRGTPDADDDEPQGGGEGDDDGALVSYKGTSTVPAGVTLSGTTVMKSVKKNANTNTVDCIQLANGYTTDNIFNNNAVILSTEGGFKAGDVLSITAFFNHNDPKTSKAEIITINDDGTTNVIWTSEQFINGKYEEADPEPQTYTLEQDMEKIYIGRNGNTGTNIIALSVVRGGTTVIKNITVNANGAIFNLAGQKVSADYKGVVVKNGVKVMQK